MSKLRTMIAAACLAAGTISVTACSTLPNEVDRSQIDTNSRQALNTLYAQNPAAKAIGQQARAVLIFPSIVKAGLGLGGAYGEGEMRKGGMVSDYYSTFTGSWGLQAGAQSYGYAVFLMNNDAVKYVEESDGWEIGVGPTVVLVNAGVAQNLSTTSLQDDAYAFIFDQKGLMAGISIEGTKINKLDK
ncbi:MAG: twin-arginine translocation pathway signal protein [Hyphomonadaceae bacterium BRH_c29]|nr:MAG: twin-arginine translocation pathway signal protein [Hyphomonadaceae bacterium BRH_c29]